MGVTFFRGGGGDRRHVALANVVSSASAEFSVALIYLGCTCLTLTVRDSVKTSQFFCDVMQRDVIQRGT